MESVVEKSMTKSNQIGRQQCQPWYVVLCMTPFTIVACRNITGYVRVFIISCKEKVIVGSRLWQKYCPWKLWKLTTDSNARFYPMISQHQPSYISNRGPNLWISNTMTHTAWVLVWWNSMLWFVYLSWETYDMKLRNWRQVFKLS